MHGEQKIWINTDRPIQIRSQFSFLYGVKKFFVSWDFARRSLWVDESDHALYWNGDLVVSTSIVNEKLSCTFGPSWKDFLLQGNLEELYTKANNALQKSSILQSKGKGKGKTESMQSQQSSQVFDVDVTDY